MSKHDNIYSILNKLNSLEPQPAKEPSLLKQLNESVHVFNPLSLKDRLTERYLAEKKMPKEVDEDMLAKKDYDGDGRRESGKAEYMGSRDKAIKKAMGKKTVVDEGEYQDTVDKSKIPAFQRKAKAAPGDDSWKVSQQDLDDEASKSPTGSAGLAKAKQRLGMNEEPQEEYNENDAHSSLPSMRKTSDQEHSEYDAAAHTIRKWMRKRGWDPKSEFKPALKYVMDNLDSSHDDTLTDEVKEAARCCDSHHQQIAELDMNLLKAAQGAMKGANTDPESERNRDKKYGYRSDRDDTGNDDDYDEHGNEKKGVKKSTPGDGPKKKGRPKKNFGPERVTKGAWKHKDGRVTEAINLETYVEDTMAELEAMFIVEKAKSKSQQRFFGMVHAAQKGEKPASKEVAKVAGEIGKKDAEDFAKTKHKGLPEKTKNKTNEGVNFAELVKETDQTIDEMLTELNMEMAEFKKTGRMGDKLRDALDMHRHAKTRLDSDMAPPPVAEQPAVAPHPHDKALDELALLAGLKGGQKELDKDDDGELTANDFAILRGDHGQEHTDESACNMTAEGVYCPEHGMNECGMMYESKDEKADQDYDEDGKIETGAEEHAGSVDKAIKKAKGEEAEEKLDECGMMGGMPGDMGQESGMSINSSVDTKTGRKTLSVTADGDSAAELAKILKMAGVVGHGGEDHDHPGSIEVHGSMDASGAEELAHDLRSAAGVDEEYANQPDERVAPVSAAVPSGNDLHKSKTQYKHSYKQGDNPMAMHEDVPIEQRLLDIYQKIKLRS